MKSFPTLHLIIIILVSLQFQSCATSMTPTEVNNKLPSLTRAKYLNQNTAISAIRNNKCYNIVQNRTYVAPIGLTVHDDLRNAARGIDEYVQMDGGNSYSLVNFRWVTVDHNGSTQLTVDFNTMDCSQ